jgi:hypothetical protein
MKDDIRGDDGCHKQAACDGGMVVLWRFCIAAIPPRLEIGKLENRL